MVLAKSLSTPKRGHRAAEFGVHALACSGITDGSPSGVDCSFSLATQHLTHRPPSPLPSALYLFAIALVLCSIHSAFAAEQSARLTNAPTQTTTNQAKAKSKPVKVKISGYGLFGDWELKRILKTLELSGKKPQFVGSSFVEDSALILSSRVKRDGYLRPRIDIELELEHGGHMHVIADDLTDNPLPRPLRFTRVRFRIHKGRLYHYDSLDIEGLQSLTLKEARSYFMETETLLHPKTARVYTPEKLKHGLSSLTDVLERQGYTNATAEVTQLHVDDKTGAATVHIKVNQDSRYIVRSVREEFYYENQTEPSLVKTITPKKPYSKIWIQDFTQSLKTNLFHHGYPDCSIELSVTNQIQTRTNRLESDLVAKAKSGPQVRIADVKFSGEKRTKVKTMSRRVRVERGVSAWSVRV